jgi:hypothetical protein
MARTAKQWEREVRSIFESEGGKNVTIEPTHGDHKLASGVFDLGGGLGTAIVYVTVSGSPGDWRAGKKVRANLRNELRKVRERHEHQRQAEVAHA